MWVRVRLLVRPPPPSAKVSAIAVPNTSFPGFDVVVTSVDVAVAVSVVVADTDALSSVALISIGFAYK